MLEMFQISVVPESWDKAEEPAFISLEYAKIDDFFVLVDVL